MITPAVALAGEGLTTGRSHMVSVTANPTAGLEAGMPRGGPYARGIEFDAREQWEASYEAYRHARDDFRRMLLRRPRWRKSIDGWIAKAEFQMEQSRRLQQQSYYRQPRARRYYISAHTYYYQAVAKHNKWLAVRAFTGRAPQKLAESAVQDYVSSLSRRANYTLARIGLAALYHELGRHDTGRQHFAKVSQRPSRWMSLNFAYYYTAAGNNQKALELLEDALRYSVSNRRHILRSNDFDRLRSHPRFRRLVGEDPS